MSAALSGTPLQMSQATTPALEPNSDSPDSIGLELREALHTVRIQSLSLHDTEGDVLWLSEGVLGPDEHGVVLEAMASHSLVPSQCVIERSLDETRNALLLPARTSAGDVVGLAMLILDAKFASPTLQTKLSDPRLLRALARLAARQQFLIGSRPALEPAAPGIPARSFDRADVLELALAPDNGDVRLTPPPSQSKPLAEAKPGAEAKAAMSAASPRGRAPAPPRAAPARSAAPEAMLHTKSVIDGEAADATVIAPTPDRRDLILLVQRLLPLRPGGCARRYEVLLRSRNGPTSEGQPDALWQAMTASDSTSAIDRYGLTDLVTWLGKHPSVWESEPTSFTINVAPSTFADHGFLPFAAALFKEWKVPPGIVGFEIPERACIKASSEIRAFIETCEKLGFFIALDDFSMHSAAVPFLASPALRLVKIDSRLTTSAMKVKLSQALVIAMSQAAKVLGVHCVAKRIDSRMTARWLAANGIDYAQGSALERLRSLDSLLIAPPTARQLVEALQIGHRVASEGSGRLACPSQYLVKFERGN